MSHTEDHLEVIKNVPDFGGAIIKGHESWYFAYNSLTKQQCVTYVGPKSLNAKRHHYQRPGRITVSPAIFLNIP